MDDDAVQTFKHSITEAAMTAMDTVDDIMIGKAKAVEHSVRELASLQIRRGMTRAHAIQQVCSFVVGVALEIEDA